MVAEAEFAGAPKPEAENTEETPITTELAMTDREMGVDVDSILAGEFEPLEFAKELDTQFELILDINKALETDLGRAKEELRELVRQNARTDKLVRQTTAGIERGKGLDERLASTRSEYENVLDQIDRTKQEIERQALIVQKKDEKIARLNEVHDRLKYDMDVLKNKRDTVDSEKAEIKNQLQTVYLDLRDLEEQKKAVEGVIKTVRLKTKATQDDILKIKRTLSNVLTAFANTQNKARLQFGRIKTIKQ